jgi:hypothetical protein
MLVVVLVALIYNLYQLWFIPERYIEKVGGSVKGWWLFADFYRKWFGSSSYLWLFRIIYLVFLLIVVTILGLLVGGVMGWFP